MNTTITFVSDYGHDDDFVGVCHGVIARIAPEVREDPNASRGPNHDIYSVGVVLHQVETGLQRIDR